MEGKVWVDTYGERGRGKAEGGHFLFKNGEGRQNGTHLSNSIATFSKMPGHLFIHSIQDLKYAVLKASFLHMMDTVRKVLVNGYQSKWIYCYDFTVLYQRDSTLSHSIPLKLEKGLSCFQRQQRKETSISVLEKDEKAAWLDVFFDEVQKLRAE